MLAHVCHVDAESGDQYPMIVASAMKSCTGRSRCTRVALNCLGLMPPQYKCETEVNDRAQDEVSSISQTDMLSKEEPSRMLWAHYICVLTAASTRGCGVWMHGTWPVHLSAYQCHLFSCHQHLTHWHFKLPEHQRSTEPSAYCWASIRMPQLRSKQAPSQAQPLLTPTLLMPPRPAAPWAAQRCRDVPRAVPVLRRLI